MADRLSLYDYLAFVIPGATILFVAVYGSAGWPWDEPGAAGTIGLVVAAFIVGYVNAALGNWIEPTFLGLRAGGRTDPLWGTLTGPTGYDDAERAVMQKLLTDRYGEVPPGLAYRLAYTDLQQQGKDAPLQLMNQHLGFTRGMATASAISAAIDLGLALTIGTELPVSLWVPLFTIATAAFVARYRRFWRRFGDHVLRGVSLLEIRSD